MRARAFCLIGCWALGFSPMWAQVGGGVALAPTVREAHIAVQLRNAWGEPVRRLEARNFQVKLVGGEISTAAPVKVEGVRDRKSHGTGVPTKLLVVLLTSDAGVVRQLPDKMDALWTNASECQSGRGEVDAVQGTTRCFLVTQPGVPLGDVILAEALLSGVSRWRGSLEARVPCGIL